MKSLKFGNGNLLITTTPNSLIVRELLSNMPIGSIQEFNRVNFKDVTQINIRNYEELNQLKEMVKNSYETPVFTFQDIRFDFTNYSRSSVDVLLDQLNWIERFLSKSLVC